MTTEPTPIPLGTLERGPIASVDEHGVLYPSGRDWTARWWVGAEDRWHRTDVDLAVRHRIVEASPVVETAVRIPSGDAIGTSYAFAHGEGAAVASEIRNASAVPIAVALVIGPVERLELRDDDGPVAWIDGRCAVVFGRRPSRIVAAPDLAALAELVADAPEPGHAHWSGYVAFVTPLPHTQSLRWQFADRRLVVPPIDSVVTGWANQAAAGAFLSGPNVDETVELGRRLLALGHGPDATDRAKATRLGALVRLGWFDEATGETEALLVNQGRKGRFEDDAATVAAVDALAGWRRAGLPPDAYEHLVAPLAAAAHAIGRRPGRLDPALGSRARTALDGASWFAASAAQPELAEDLARFASRFGETPGLAIDDPLSAAIDALVCERAGGVELLAGWDPTWAGGIVDVRRLPTRFGLVSFSVRWHGERPALLWELEAWPSPAGGPVVDVTVTCGIDPDWSATGTGGDALLARPLVVGR